jgi:molybdate transport system ATP-binding protein
MQRSGPGVPSFLLDVAVDLPTGITILFGPSGAGKSTLLNCIAGLLRPDAGRISVGEDLLFDSESCINVPPQARRIAYVFQSLALFPHMTVEQNVAYGLDHLQGSERRARVADALQGFHVDALSKRRPEEISGGERQRVALARSLVTLPRALLLDEPLTGLDAALKASIVDDLRAWNAAHQIPILYVTHNRDEVNALGERVIAMDAGRVVSEGTPMEVLEAPRRQNLAQAAGFENLLSGTVAKVRESDGVMRVELAGGRCEIEVPLGYAAEGRSVRVAIRAGDILLATERPSGISARNVLHGTVVSLEHLGLTVVARVNCGAEFIVHITRAAERDLHLGTGKSVWLIIKTHSCHLLRQ